MQINFPRFLLTSIRQPQIKHKNKLITDRNYCKVQNKVANQIIVHDNSLHNIKIDIVEEYMILCVGNITQCFA